MTKIAQSGHSWYRDFNDTFMTEKIQSDEEDYLADKTQKLIEDEEILNDLTRNLVDKTEYFETNFHNQPLTHRRPMPMNNNLPFQRRALNNIYGNDIYGPNPQQPRYSVPRPQRGTQ